MPSPASAEPTASTWEWPLLFPPDRYGGVRLDGPGSLRRLVTSTETLDPETVDRVAAALSHALPPK